MTSPDNFTTPEAWTPTTVAGLQDVTDEDGTDLAFADTETLLQAVFDTFIDNLLGGFADIPEALGEFLGELRDAITGVAVGAGPLADIFNRIASILANATSAATGVAKLQTSLAVGATFTDTFDRADSVVLGNGWVQGGDGQGLGLIDNAARIDNGGVDEGRQYAICPIVAAVDDVLVSTVVNPAGVATAAMTTLLLRGNADLTEFVYANVYGRSCYLGHGTRSGNSWSFTDWTSNTDRGVDEGALVEFSAQGDVYDLKVNGVTLLHHVDTSAYPVDVDHRTTGFASETKTVTFLPRYSWGLATFAHRPYDLGSVGDAQQTADSAQVTATATAAQLADLLAEQGSGGGDTESYSVLFPGQGADGDPLPGFTVPKFPKIGYTDNNIAGWRAAEEGNGYARYDDPLVGVDQEVSVVFGTRPSTRAGTGLFLRARDDLTGSFAFAQVYRQAVLFGVGYKDGSGELILGDILEDKYDLAIETGSTVTFTAAGDNYTVRVNGYPVVTKTIAAAQISQAADRRYHGLIFSGATEFGLHYSSGDVYQYTASDITVPDTLGTGWTLFRASLANTADIPGDYNRLQTSVFDNSRNIANTTVGSLGLGIVVVERSGWYQISARYQLDIDNEDQDYGRMLLYSLPPGSGTWQLVDVGNQDNSGDMARTSGASFIRYCVEGESLQPGYFWYDGVGELHTVNFVGDTLGTVTYFKGALVSAPRGARGGQGPEGPEGPAGPQGDGLHIDEQVGEYAELPAAPADGYAVYVDADGMLYLYLGGMWPAQGNGMLVRGPQGEAGADGIDGIDGAPGDDGADGIDGADGTNVTIQRVTSLPATGTPGVIYWLPVT